MTKKTKKMYLFLFITIQLLSGLNSAFADDQVYRFYRSLSTQGPSSGRLHNYQGYSYSTSTGSISSSTPAPEASVPHAPTHEDFIKGIKLLDNTYNLQTMRHSHKLRKLLFSNPSVINHLSRSSETITFHDDHPVLDEYELKIYELLENYLPYRGNSGTRKFYDSITDKAIMGKYKVKTLDHNMYIHSPCNFVEVLTVILHAIQPSEQPGAVKFPETHCCAFLFFPIEQTTENSTTKEKGKHAYTIMVIFDNLKKQPLAIIILDSGKLNKQNFDMINERCLGKAIDASHDLQTTKENKNCALYTINFLQDVQKLLKNETVYDYVYKNATLFTTENEAEKTQAIKNLQFVFKNLLSYQMPCYYDQSGKKKSDKQIKEFHLRQRWDIGSEFIKDPSLLEATGIFTQGTKASRSEDYKE